MHCEECLEYISIQRRFFSHFYDSAQVHSHRDLSELFTTVWRIFSRGSFAAFPALILADFLVVFSSHISTFSLILKGFYIGQELSSNAQNLNPDTIQKQVKLWLLYTCLCNLLLDINIIQYIHNIIG